MDIVRATGVAKPGPAIGTLGDLTLDPCGATTIDGFIRRELWAPLPVAAAAAAAVGCVGGVGA